MDPIQSWWDDCNCSTSTFDQKKVAPICQHNMCPAGGWELFEGHCYLLVESIATWTDAEKDCNNKGGHLASIHSEDESNFIRSLQPGNLLWIGGTDAALEVGFTIKVHNEYFINLRFPQLRAVLNRRFRTWLIK